MKSKTLANVLIKLLGLSICLYAIPSVVSNIIETFIGFGQDRTAFVYTHLIPYGIDSVVKGIMGVMVILSSRKIAGLFFRDDEE